jgi:YVTN family beta-propeller protein
MSGRAVWRTAKGLSLAIGFLFALAGPPARAQIGYVVNSSDNTVNQFDAANESVLPGLPIAVGRRPTAVAIDFSYSHVYIANSDDRSISVIDTETVKVVNTITNVGAHALATNSLGRLFAAQGGFLTVIDTNSNVAIGDPIAVVAANSSGCPIFDGNSIAAASSGSRVYVPTIDGCIGADPFLEPGAIAVIDTQTGTAQTSIPVGRYPTSATLSPAGDRVYVTNWVDGTVSVIDTATNTVVDLIALRANANANGFPINSAIAGSRLYVANNGANSVSVVDTLSDQLVGGEIPVGYQPIGIAASSDGQRVFVTNQGSNSASVIHTATNEVATTLPFGSAPVAVAITRFLSDNVYFNLDQHGVTGSWFDPGSGGQGLELELYPDVNGTGRGTLFGGWFTYDTSAAGGRRWYAMLGDADSSMLGLSLLQIYDVEGGNLNALPSLGATGLLGTATLVFVDCDNATLGYSFYDGRHGAIPLVRLTPNVTCGISGDNGNPSTDYLLSGNWYNPQTSGQGLMFDFSPSITTVFAAWYTFKPNGQQIGGAASQDWYTLQSSHFTPSTTALSNIPIVETSGGIFANGTPTTSIQAGSADIVLQTCDAMTVNYRFTAGENQGISGSMNLVRVGPTPEGCSLP